MAASLWFEVASVMAIVAFGNVFFSHFEERTPKWRRALKPVVTLAIVVAISATFGRAWAARMGRGARPIN